MILHYAHLCAAAGGVDAFLIGSELRGLTQVRERRVELSGGRRARRPRRRRARDPRVRARSSATPPTGRSTSGTTRRTARATSSSTSTRSGRTTTIDFVGIDNYMPLVRLARRARPSRRRERRRDHRPRLPARQHRGRRGLRLVLRQRRRPRGAGPDADHRRRRRQALGVPLQGPAQLVVEPAPQPAGRGRERRADGLGAGEQADPLHRDRLPGGRPRPEPAERLLRPEVGRELPAVLLARLARRRRSSGASSRRCSATGPSRRTTRSPASIGGRMITHRRDRRLDLGRAAVPGVPGAERRLDRRRQLAARALAERPARLGLARQRWCASSAAAPGCPTSQIDASALADVVHGYLITALESPRASIAPLARQFGFDAVESEGVIRFQPRDRRPVATLGLDDLAVGERADGEVIELVRAQETELPQALKWQVLNAEEDYDAMTRRGAARHRRGAARHLRELRHRHARQRRRPALPPGAARGMGRPRDRVVPAAAVAARARSRRRRAARPRRPADLAAADLDRRCRRARHRGGAHRRRRLRAGARTRARAAGAAAGGLRPAERRVPRPAAAPRERAGAPAARGRLRRALAGPGRGLAQPGRGRLRAASPRSAGRRGSGGSSPTSIPGRCRASTSATSRSSISPSARSRASPTSRSSAAPTRWRSRRRPASGRCCSSASPS